MQRSLPQPEKRGFFQTNFVGAMIWLLRIATVVIVVWGAYNSISAGTYSLSQWKDLVIFGLAQGGMYGLIALGYTLIYGILGFINFAHGDIFMSGMMVGYFVADDLNTLGFWNAHPVISLLIILAVSMTTSCLVAIIIERIAYKPLRNAPRLIPLITSIGASFSLEYLFKGLFGAAAKSYPDMKAIDGFLNIGGFRILKTQVLVLGGVLVMMVFLYWFVEHTRAGKSIRSVAEDKEIAALMGVNVERTIIITFALGGAMAGAAGLFYALVFNQVYFLAGFVPGIKAFTAAVLGGIGNIPGAMVGGVTLGLLESLGPVLILAGLGVPAPHQLNDVVAFAVLTLVLIFRPTGLLGERLSQEKA